MSSLLGRAVYRGICVYWLLGWLVPVLPPRGLYLLWGLSFRGVVLSGVGRLRGWLLEKLIHLVLAGGCIRLFFSLVVVRLIILLFSWYILTILSTPFPLTVT